MFHVADKPILSEAEVEKLCKDLEPKTKVILEGKVRRLGAFLNLELLTAAKETFHRVFKGIHGRTQDRVLLHLYDLSALSGTSAEKLAEREFRVLQLLQKSPWVPRFRDSLQDAPGYPGELLFFTILDPAAPKLAERSDDTRWGHGERLTFVE